MIEDKIANIITSMAGSQTAYNIFSDWVEIMALSLANASCLRHDALWQKRETQYQNIVKKYSIEDISKFVCMFNLLCECYEEQGPYDALGSIFMKAGCGSKATGQFFTPFHLSQLMSDVVLEHNNDDIITLNEPSVGGGGMILAAAATLLKQGKNPQKILKIVAQDLDYRCVFMAYVQFSLNGLDAIVTQGSTLTEPYVPGEEFPEERLWRTPKNRGCLI